MWRLHQFLVGLRRRHPWLHAATTRSLQLANRHYVYETRSGDDALLIALNIDDEPLPLLPSELGLARVEVVAGSAAPPSGIVGEVTVEPHGWRILRPA
jgi:hypothetical protein